MEEGMKRETVPGRRKRSTRRPRPAKLSEQKDGSTSSEKTSSASSRSDSGTNESFGVQDMTPGWPSPKVEPVSKQDSEETSRKFVSPGQMEEGMARETVFIPSPFGSLGKPSLAGGRLPEVDEESSPLESEGSLESQSSEGSGSRESSYSADLREEGKKKWDPQIPVFTPAADRVSASVSEEKQDDYDPKAYNNPHVDGTGTTVNQSALDAKKDNVFMPPPDPPEHSLGQQELSEPDIEQGLGASSENDKRNSQNEGGFPWRWLCCLLLALLIVAGGVVAAVLLTGDDDSTKGGNQPTPPTPSPSTATRTPTKTPGLRPTAPPITIVDGVDSFITESLVSVGGASTLNDPASPQSQALEWILGDASLNAYSKPRILQRYVLAAFYFSTMGDSWENNDGWLTDQDECDWYTSETETSICNTGGELYEIDLDDNNVGGRVPWIDFAMLSNQLLVIDFYENSISGSFPSQFGFLTSLVSLDLFANQLSGTIPTDIGFLTALRYQDCDTNFLTGQIPREVSSMTNLETLWLNNNLLTGSIPSELGLMSNLRNLYLRNNLLTGTMPTEICALNLENLEVSCDLVECSCCTNSDCNPTNDPLSDLLISVSPDGGAALQDKNSPQYAALEWLRSPLNNAFLSDERLIQRYALVTLYYSTNGEQWKSSFLWLTSADECIWFTTSRANTICDNNGNIVELDLRENNLLGTLPAEILLLSNTLGE
jgi:hypothetical protein